MLAMRLAGGATRDTINISQTEWRSRDRIRYVASEKLFNPLLGDNLDWSYQEGSSGGCQSSRGLQKGKCVLPLRVHSDCDVPLELQTRQWLDFSNPRLYDEQLSRLVADVEKRSGIVLPADSLIRYNNAPALPESFVNRPELLEALRNTLFTEGSNRNIAVTAIQGMGGIGKTDPTGLSSGEHRVLRGGSWRSVEREARASTKAWATL